MEFYTDLLMPSLDNGIWFFTVWHRFILRGLTSILLKSVDLVVGTWWLPLLLKMEIFCNFLSEYFDCRCTFQRFCWFALLCNIADNKASLALLLTGVKISEGHNFRGFSLGYCGCLDVCILGNSSIQTEW